VLQALYLSVLLLKKLNALYKSIASKMLRQIINFIKKAARKKDHPHSRSRSNFTKGGKVGANLNAINVRRVRSSLMFYQKEKKPLLITNKRTPFFQCSLRWLLEGFQSVVLVIF